MSKKKIQTKSILRQNRFYGSIINYLPNDKILVQSNFKAFADGILNVLQIICASGWVENIVGTGENAGYQHFLLFPQFFPKPFLSDR